MADPQLDSDDDAPEEITLNEGREEAEQSRRNEKENSKRLAAELKEKRKSRSEKKSKKSVAEGDGKSGKKEVLTSPEKKRVRKRKGRQAGEANSGEELAGKAIGSVMLDESVVQLIRAREMQVGKGVGESKHKYIEEPEPEPESMPKPKLKKPSELNNGPSNSRTQIVSLHAKPNASAINSALEFRRNHFFGPQVKRSTAMLPTSRPHLASV